QLCVTFSSHLLYLLTFFFPDTTTSSSYTLSLHDALPIFTGESDPAPTSRPRPSNVQNGFIRAARSGPSRISYSCPGWPHSASNRSEEHTSELQSRFDLVCRLLLEKKKTKRNKKQSKYIK